MASIRYFSDDGQEFRSLKEAEEHDCDVMISDPLFQLINSHDAFAGDTYEEPTVSIVDVFRFLVGSKAEIVRLLSEGDKAGGPEA